MRYEILKYERIRTLRTENNLSQSDMAKHLNVHQTTYSDYELGNINIPTEALIFIADLFKVNIDYILGRTDEKQMLPKAKKYKRN